jgi:electron transfer flavoprotein alpha subunit
MRIAVLVKQIPIPSEMRLSGGSIVRDRVRLETNSYCRRANTRAVELAGNDGEVVVFSMGPPAAEQVLREMIACGATRGVLLTDRALAGSDTLITARVLGRALELNGPFDLVLTGAFSLDSETGHVGIQIAEILGFPFIGPCRALDVIDGVAVAAVECDGGFCDVEVLLPAVASAAERLCAPSKASAEQCAAVAEQRITRLSAADLGLLDKQVGLPASPTQVGVVSQVLADHVRARIKTTSARDALRLLGTLERTTTDSAPQLRALVDPAHGSANALWCVLDPRSERPNEDLLCAVTGLAHVARRPVVAAVSDLFDGLPELADHTLRFSGSDAPEDWVRPLCDRLLLAEPHCVIIEASNWGRELGARTAARLGWGLVGDAVRFSVEDGRIVAWKSAFSGQAMVPITSTSPALLATVRPGALSSSPVGRAPGSPALIETIATASVSRVIYDPARDTDPARWELGLARCVVIVGSGVPPDEYPALDELRMLLDAGPLACTRKVTDRGWLPRTRQIGITGRRVAPDLVISIAANGSFNHSSGFLRAGRVLAINRDPEAQIFHYADVGIVGDWHQVVGDLCDVLRASATSI